jgi:phosphoglycerol transferase MdoB-like AlkP superfamily enzyme
MLKKLNYMKRIVFHSVYVAAVWNFALSIALFMLCRMLFWTFNANLFPDMTASQIPSILAGGLRFDLSALAYGNALWLLLMLIPAKFRYNAYYQKVCKAIFITFNAILLAANCLDFVYFPYTLRRTTAGFLQEFGGEAHLGSIVARTFIDQWYVYLIWFAMIGALALCYRKAWRSSFNYGLPQNIGYYAGSAAALALAIALSVAAMRGGIKYSVRPITLNDAGQYVRRPLEKAIVQNTPHSIFRTLGKKHRAMVSFFNDEKELETYYNPLHTPSPQDAFIPKNVVVIIWESFAKEYVGALNGNLDGGAYKGYTPFIDSLLPHALTFTRSYANGRKSIDGLPSVIASIPSVENPFVLSPYSGNNVNSLGSLLKEKGYRTAFFHGAPNGSMGFWAFLNMAGFDEYYGKDEYCSHYREDGGLWGIWDEEFLQFMAAKLGSMPQPFCAAVFTLTSHAPFILPQKYDGRWQEGPHPITRCISYSDYALQQFFRTAEQQEWFKNTIFVITADHSNHPLHPEYQTSVGQMSVPIIYYAPDGSLRGMRHGITQQSDIMPTILTMLNYDKPYIAFGRNALDDADSMGIAINYISGVYQVFCGKYVMLHDGEQILGLYDLNSDIMLKTNKLNSVPPHEEMRHTADMLEQKLKAFMQQYNNRMIENRMTAK